MASVTLNTIYYFQPPGSADKVLNAPSQGRSAAWKGRRSKLSNELYNANAPTISTTTSPIPENCNRIESVDLTTPQPKETFSDLFGFRG